MSGWEGWKNWDGAWLLLDGKRIDVGGDPHTDAIYEYPEAFGLNQSELPEDGGIEFDDGTWPDWVVVLIFYNAIKASVNRKVNRVEFVTDPRLKTKHIKLMQGYLTDSKLPPYRTTVRVSPLGGKGIEAPMNDFLFIKTPVHLRKIATAALGKHIYHTTSLQALRSIMRSRKLEPRNVDNPFVSFSEVPYFGDISSNEVVFVFDASALRSSVMKVEYNERWYEKYPDHAAYIAGEGWREQYTESEECYDYDEEEGWKEVDEECREQHYKEAEFWAFEAKSDEKEWISKSEHKPVKYKDDALVKILINTDGGAEKAVRGELVKLGLDHVEVERL